MEIKIQCFELSSLTKISYETIYYILQKMVENLLKINEQQYLIDLCQERIPKIS